MRFLAFRQKSTGKWTNALFTTAGDSFVAKQTTSRRRDIAADLGIPMKDLEGVAGTTDPRSGAHLTLPTAHPSPQVEARDRALAGITANKDVAPWGRILYDLAVADGYRESEGPTGP